MDGIIINSNSDYHAGPGLSSSDLKLLAKSPLHYWDAKINPDQGEREETKALTIGSAVHCAVLEQDDFPYRYAVVPEGVDKRSNAGKALFKEIEANGKTPLKTEEYETVMKVAASLHSNKDFRAIIGHGGHVETSIYWTDDETGVLCKCRPDFYIEPCAEYPFGLILDVKTAEDASEEGFKRAAFSYGYHISAAWYCSGFSKHFSTADLPPFVFAVVEKKRPFATRLYIASEEQMLLGHMECERLLALFHECSQADQWPGYGSGITPLGLPAWAMKNIDSNEEIEVEYV